MISTYFYAHDCVELGKKKKSMLDDTVFITNGLF